MVDVNTQNKTISVNVSSSGVSSNVNASGDTTLYYSNKAKEWAISNRIVDGVDYSSKYYAGRANQSALNAQSFAQSALETLNNVDNKVQEAIDNIETQKQDTITEIQNIATTQKEEIENLSEQEQSKIIDLGIDTRANVDLSNLSEVGEKHFLGKSQITNCLTETPQRIKYTLVDGVLTVLAGSVVIVPYGVEDLTADYPIGSTFINDNFKVYDTQFADGKFFVWAEVVNDIIATSSYTNETFGFLSIRLEDNIVWIGKHCYSGSGTTAGNNYSQYYNTERNYVNTSTATTTVVTENNTHCLPFMTANSSESNGFATINQVFNGFGYIGSTIWVDKGVKGLIPDGRNEDGSLKNIEFVCNKLSTRTFNDTVNTAIIFIGDEGIARLSNTTYRYDADTNYNKNVDVNWQVLFIATLTTTSGIISNFQPKQPFRAIDYSDKSEVSGFAMPSDRYINLTLGASSTTYTAPANGWFALTKQASASGQYIQFRSDVTNLICKAISVGKSDILCIFFPAKKRQALKAEYSAQGATSYFRFIYAEGEV